MKCDQLIGIGVASLAPDEYWCIDHDEGPLWETMSKNIIDPVVIFCEATKIAWDDAKASGFRLGKVKIP